MIASLRTLLDKFLRLPELKEFEGIDFDIAEVTVVQREIFKKKKALQIIYQEYCRPAVESAQQASPGSVMVEIGSGVSPLKELIPGLICTDIIAFPWLEFVTSAYALPFKDNSLDRIFLIFVCHHLGKIEKFLDEAYRCLRPGGEMVIIDPAVTMFSMLYGKYIHVDRADLQVKEWGFEGTGRLSDSNFALVWIIFFRDRERFKSLYPDFVIEKVEYNTCLSYLLSGGLRIRQLMPTWFISKLFAVENWFIRHVSRQIALTMAVTIKKL